MPLTGVTLVLVSNVYVDSWRVIKLQVTQLVSCS